MCEMQVRQACTLKPRIAVKAIPVQVQGTGMELLQQGRKAHLRCMANRYASKHLDRPAQTTDMWTHNIGSCRMPNNLAVLCLAAAL